MDLGISLSQLASQRPVSTCHAELDAVLDGGFHPRCIYEIYGPPGVGKTTLALAAAAASGSALYIHTHKPVPPPPLPPTTRRQQPVDEVRITRFGHLLFFLQRLQRLQPQHCPRRPDGGYAVLVIDGFAQLVQDHVHQARKACSAAAPVASLHEYKCRHLALVLTELTRYAAQHGTAVLLVDHCLPAQHELRSALEAGVAAGARDASWRAFVRQSVGVYRDWAAAGARQQQQQNVAGAAAGTAAAGVVVVVLALVGGHRVRLRHPPEPAPLAPLAPHAEAVAEAVADSQTVQDSQ